MEREKDSTEGKPVQNRDKQPYEQPQVFFIGSISELLAGAQGTVDDQNLGAMNVGG